LARLEITDHKNQITNKTQCPISEILNKNEVFKVVLRPLFFIVIYSLRFIPDQNIRGQAWDLIFGISGLSGLGLV